VEAARWLLQLAQAQACALEDGELARFARLQDERDDALRRVERSVGPPERAAVRETLQAAVEVDRRTASRLHALRAETERALRQLRQGHSAVAGYGRIGAYLSSSRSQVDRLR
jgi:hypothetical protein